MDPAFPIDQGAITVKRQHIEILQAAFRLNGSAGWVGDLIGHGVAVPFVICGPAIAVVTWRGEEVTGLCLPT